MPRSWSNAGSPRTTQFELPPIRDRRSTPCKRQNCLNGKHSTCVFQKCKHFFANIFLSGYIDFFGQNLTDLFLSWVDSIFLEWRASIHACKSPSHRRADRERIQSDSSRSKRGACIPVTRCDQWMCQRLIDIASVMASKRSGMRFTTWSLQQDMVGSDTKSGQFRGWFWQLDAILNRPPTQQNSFRKSRGWVSSQRKRGCH